MRVLVVFCHPNPESFGAHLREQALAGLGAHDVRLIDLYGEAFNPVMSREDRAIYHTRHDNEVAVADHIAQLKWADTVVFIYPTWWFNMPAMLKGWLDRVLVPYATFILPDGENPMRPQLTNIRRIVAITTCGARFIQSKFVGEPARRTLLRGFRFICHPKCKTHYLALYGIDTSTEDARNAYAAKVKRTLERLPAT